MLTIREPIALKTVRPMQGIRPDMAERMQANYGLMNLSIRKEELLHITSQPAEIYFADSENFQILTNINNQNNQEIRLDVINNLMNRILVSQTENFTYQDTVYISTILRKLGIRDEKTFMKQVFDIQNEHKETNRLLHKYEKNQEILKQLIQSEEKQEKSEIRKQQELTIQNRRYFIHDEIFKRLETGKIYQDMRSFSKGYYHESRQIFPREMQVAEQTKAAQNFLLQNIKNEVTGQVTPLHYLHNNRYEYLQEITEELTLELEEQMSAAILLNLAEQSYMLRQTQVEENNHYWYSIARSFFQTAENTWKRYEANLVERKQFSTKMVQVLEQVNHAKHLEGDVISNIVEEYYSDLQKWKEENEIHQSFLTQKTLQENKNQEVHFSGGSYHLTEEEFQLNYLTEEENEEDSHENILTVEQLQKQLEIFNQRNYENYQKITQIEQQQKSLKDRKVNRRKARMDALRALENPNEVLMEYITTEYKDPVIEVQEKMGAQIYELLSEETKEIYRQFLNQNNSSKQTFLNYIMSHPQEKETQKEVIQVLEKIEKQEELLKTKQEEIESVKQLTFLNNINTKEKVQQQLILWKEIQNYPKIDVEDDIYIQNRTTEEVFTQENQLKHLKTELKSEKNIESLVTGETKEIENQQLTLWKEIQEISGEDTEDGEDLHSKTKEILHTKEIQFVELRENVEKQMKRQQNELAVVNVNAQKEIRRQQIEFVHKKEEQLINEELLEEIRTQSQKTIQNRETEETTMKNEREVHQVVQETVNKIQTNRVDNIEELVQQSVKRQLNQLSEQIYTKMEKKLQTERKRRGYF